MVDSAPALAERFFHTFVIKVHSRCDLACSYCYMYEAFDRDWRSMPRRMPRDVLEWTARRIAEHARTHRIPEVSVVLHGGEPLLAGAEWIAFAVETFRREVAADTKVDFAIQTNGLGLTRDGYLDMLADLDVRIGVSVDGTADDHDRHRRFRDGSGSHRAVSEALTLLRTGPYQSLFSGLLCTIDPRTDPVGTYEALLEHRPPMVDLLLPHGNWDNPPPLLVPESGSTPYADWLIAVFDRWFDVPVRETRVRVFTETINLLLGGRARVEGLGLEPLGYLVVETDGAIGQCDALRTAYEGATKLPLHVASDPFDRVLLEPAVVARQSGLAALAGTCRACALRRVCGGGHYVHRYRSATGFANPSVYCADLYAYIRHVRARVDAAIGALRQSL
jgi:uncharacterized protein